MAINSRILARGAGWKVSDVVCDHGPRDRTFVEEHNAVSIAAVTEGSFQYRTQAGSAVLVPGAFLLGNAGSCFECRHEHGQGDRCLGFHFTPAFVDSVAASLPGVRTTRFTCAAVPPLHELTGLAAESEAARDDGDAAALEEIALRLVGAALVVTAGNNKPARRPSARDERRMTNVARRIAARAQDGEQDEDSPTLDALAREAAMSPYHFLRTFRQVIGMTPHQYILQRRLHRAARQLRSDTRSISAIAFEAGFNDLATFNRRFRRLLGMTPSAYRAVARPGD